MKTRLLCLSLAVLLAGAGAALANPPAPDPWTGNFNLRVGAKFLGGGDWSPVDDHTLWGLHFDFRRPHWPLNLVLDVSYSFDEADRRVHLAGIGPERQEVEGRTFEWNLGVRKIWEDHRHLRPYVGFGPAVIWAEQRTDATVAAAKKDDTGLGFWLGGGLYATLYDRLNLGLDLRYSYAKVDLFEDVNAGGFQAGMLVGYHF